MISERTNEEVLNITQGLFKYYCSMDKFKIDDEKLKNNKIFIASLNNPLYLDTEEKRKKTFNSLIVEFNKFAHRDDLKLYSQLKPHSVTIYFKNKDNSNYYGEIPNWAVKKVEKAINGSEKAVMISAVVHCHGPKPSHIHVVWNYIKGKRSRHKVLENIDNIIWGDFMTKKR